MAGTAGGMLRLVGRRPRFMKADYPRFCGGFKGTHHDLEAPGHRHSRCASKHLLQSHSADQFRPSAGTAVAHNLEQGLQKNASSVPTQPKHFPFLALIPSILSLAPFPPTHRIPQPPTPRTHASNVPTQPTSISPGRHPPTTVTTANSRNIIQQWSPPQQSSLRVCQQACMQFVARHLWPHTQPTLPAQPGPGNTSLHAQHTRWPHSLRGDGAA